MAEAEKKKETTKKVIEEETASPYPVMSLAQEIHRLTLAASSPGATPDTTLESKVFDQITTELQNPSLYTSLHTKLYGDHNKESTIASAKLTPDTLQTMRDSNAAELVTLEAAIADATESAGDMEVMDARVAVARFCTRTGTAAEAQAAYRDVLALPKQSNGKLMDAHMACARIASFYGDVQEADACLDKANELGEASGGADWDRRNRLKVYRALQRLQHRDIKTASTLLLDCIATFSCNEICSFREFIVYTVLTNLLHLSRPELKSKIIAGPEVLSVALEIPEVIKLVQSFYDCDYKAYLHAMLDVEDVLLKDRYLYPHAAYWMRELHLLAYKQFLDSYQSVTLEAMANAFGVSQDFIDHHASRFIAAGSLTAKIDKFGGVIVSSRPDLKNKQYREMIQKGDLLLNRIQKLGRVVDL